MSEALRIEQDVPLAGRCTLQLGGAARFFARARSERDVVEALRWARAQGVRATVLGAGSNVVIADEGFDGLIIAMEHRGIMVRPDGPRAVVTAMAGEPWDALVARAVHNGAGGIECLSGIPGLVGATPIQNVGAYGQEVAETIVRVRALDRATLEIVELAPEACEFSYRDSVFKRHPERYVVVAVTFALVRGAPPQVRYLELERELAQSSGRPSLADARQAVLALRRRKSMVIDAGDPNRRSVGSFFTNPVLERDQAERVIARAVHAGLAHTPEQVPRYPADGDRVKLSAGWLIERSGIAKGYRQGPVGVSSAHALSLVHHGGGRTRDLLALARHVRDTVEATLGVRLTPEPVLLGIEEGL